MSLTRLALRDFRCFADLELDLSPRANLITGANASGKTSLLEAVFFLGRARSFRTPKSEQLVRHGAEGFLLSGQSRAEAGTVALGIARGPKGLEARIAGEPAQSLAQLAERLPVQLFDAGAHQLIEGGPRHRRQFLDWGVFHVEPAFLTAWRRYQRALKQRNTLLRQRAGEDLLKTWEPELAEAGSLLDQSRRRYLADLESLVLEWASRLLGGTELSVQYQRGWTEGRTLEEALALGRPRDREQGVTQAGPHRAELLIQVGGMPAAQRVSRGQQKVLAGALLLAQAMFLHRSTGRDCVLLLDDLAAELDTHHQGRFQELVRESQAQVFLTSVEPERVGRWPEARMFHVEQGKIRQMV
ncbi:MAG TPA: DNA replication/repair protein RecF [Gammaproteobacteria bacterium]|nr:DNA replication/repair protein RecF [Gammaproteobacteria bacterium]